MRKIRLAASLLPCREPACHFPATGPLLRPVTHAPQWCSALGTRRRVAVHTPPAPHRAFAARAQPAQPQQRTEQLSRRCSASRRMKPVLRGQPQSAWAAPRWRPGPRCAVRPGRTAPRAPPHGSPPRARPTAPPRHAQRWARRLPWKLGAGAGACTPSPAERGGRVGLSASPGSLIDTPSPLLACAG